MSALTLSALLALGIVACNETRTPEAAGPQWSVEAQPTFDVGADSADTPDGFGDVNGAARLADGSVVVADRKASALKFFAPNGAFLRSVGRKGNGPSEFEYLAEMLRCGDSLFVRDIGTRKYSVFSIDGTFARQFAFDPPEAGQIAYRSACNRDGVFISYGWETRRDMPTKSSVFRSSVPYWLSKSDGAVLTGLGQHASSERWFHRSATGAGTGPLPLGKQPAVAAGRSRAYIGTADSFYINVFGLDGTPQGALQRSGTVVRTTPADIARYKMLDTSGGTQEAITNKLREWQEIQFPPTLPAYTALVVDSDDHLWVRTFPATTETTATWIVFSPTGEEVAALALPYTLMVDEIGNDYVLGTDTNIETGVKQVKVFRLHRSPSSTSR